jgi:hypothetical protein
MSNRRGSAGKSEPTTVRPPFDPEAFARESDSKVQDAIPASARPTVPPAPLPSVSPTSGSTEVPTLAVARDDLEWFDLSPAVRELLRHVNGRDSVEAISRVVRRSAAEIVCDLAPLVTEGLVTWR